jgi:hypothetical protein
VKVKTDFSTTFRQPKDGGHDITIRIPILSGLTFMSSAGDCRAIED